MRTALHLLVLSTLLVTPGLVAGAFAQPGAAAGVSPALDESPGFLARQTAADYRARARFPESSRPLEAGDADPVRAKRVPAPHSLATPGVEGLLTLWPQETSFPVGEPVELHAAVTGLSQSEIARMEVTGEVVDGEGDVLGTVTYRDDGRGADAVPRDGTFGATFVLSPGQEPDLAASYLVRVTATKPDGESLRAAGGFLVSNPHARLTGAVDSRVDDGNLVVTVEVEVERPGRYHLAATLTTMKGEPVAWAQVAELLDAGTHELELTYYGLIFHDGTSQDGGVAGPFRVASLALTNASGMPNAPAPLVEAAAVIPALPLAKLTRTPFGDPSLLEAAERLETQAASSPGRR